MYTGCLVELKMEKVIRLETIFDDATYECKVVEYNQEEECFCLMLKYHDLTALSLDAKYQCSIEVSEGKLSCNGRIKERFQNQEGNMLVFQVENGFYKISIN